MAVLWDPRGDFSGVIDGAETVLLRRRDTGAEEPIPSAWRQVQHVAEAEPGDGRAERADVRWALEAPAGGPPGLGDALIDSLGECWTVLSVEPLRLGTRLRCETRSLRIAHALDAWIDIQRETAAGVWTTVRSHVAARVQPSSTEVDRAANPPTGVRRYRVLLAEGAAIDATTRLIDAAGRVLIPERVEDEGRIDVPQAIVAVEQ